MRKQTFVIGAILILAISAWAFLLAAPVNNKKIASPKCTKTCQNKAITYPQTGFFIFDSFSGNL
jgi:hypothetical protein